MKAILNYDIQQFRSNPFYMTFFVVMMLCSIAVIIVQAIDFTTNRSLEGLGPSLYVLFITTYVYIALPMIGMKKNERSNYHMLLFSMPVKRNTIVFVKFFEIGVLFIVSCLFGVLTYIVTAFIFGNFELNGLLTFIVVPMLSNALLGAFYTTIFMTSRFYYAIIPVIYFITLLSFSVSGFLDVAWIVPNGLLIIGCCFLLIMSMYYFSIYMVQRKEF